jgi:ABC-type cobalamin/Fe3+-siderophores transport system ATPase subunit
MEDLSLPELAESLDRARQGEVAAIRSALEDNQVVGVTGAAESGKSKLLRLAVAPLELDTNVAVVWIDLDGVYSPRHLARRWLRATARAAAGPIAFSHISALGRDMWPGQTRHADHVIREVLRDNYDVVLGAKGNERSKGGDEDIAVALAATDRLVQRTRTLVVVDHLEALELSRAFDVRKLLWQLRAASQRQSAMGIALVCRPGAIDVAADEEAAFYGDGTWIRVESPGRDVWRAATQGWERLDEVLQQTHGHVWSTLLVIDRVRRDRRLSVARAFADLAFEEQRLADRCVQHAASLHRLGPELLRAIANDLGPYQAIPDALSRDVATAARRLELGGMTHRPQRGVWRLVDPLVAAALRDGELTSGFT